MKQTITFKSCMLVLIASLLPQLAGAYDFMVNNIAYNVVSASNNTVEVAPKTSSSAGGDGSANYSGNVVINESVYYSGKNYTVVGIGESAFKNSFISSIKLPETLTYIKKEAFSTCFELTELSIPASVTEIGTSCFWVCPDLMNVYAYGTTPATCSGTNVFSYMQYNDATLHVPYGCLSKYQNAYGWKDFPHFEEMAPAINGHEYVDLQLPSGKLWATMNYGATSPYNYGNYVEWSSNDVVTNSWGNEWYTPTINDIKELINNCQWTWTTENGTIGYLVRGNNGNTIFLPAAGIKMGSVMNAGSWCYYWSSTPESGSMTYILLATSSSVWYGSQNTMASLPIRPVAENNTGNVLATGISLNKTELSLLVGETETLTAAVMPENVTNGSVTWSSSNASVATVDSYGKVTAIAAGSTSITATTTDGTNLSASCSVVVNQSSNFATSIYLNKDMSTLNIGNTDVLFAYANPSDAINRFVTWSSSNPNIVSVSTDSINEWRTLTKSFDKTLRFKKVRVKPNGNTDQYIFYLFSRYPNGQEDDLVYGISTNYIGAFDGSPGEIFYGPDYKTEEDFTYVGDGWYEYEFSTYLYFSYGQMNVTENSVQVFVENSTSTANSAIMTAMSQGNATVTATTTDGTNLSASCSVVVDLSSNFATSIYLNKDMSTLNIGNTDALLAYANPSDAINRFVTWSSSDPSIVSVSTDSINEWRTLTKTFDKTLRFKKVRVKPNVSTDQNVFYDFSRYPNGQEDELIYSISTHDLGIFDGSTNANFWGPDYINSEEEFTYVGDGWYEYEYSSFLYYCSAQYNCSENSVQVFVENSTSTANVATITAMSLGNATVTAATTDGTNLSASCFVTVTSSEEPQTIQVGYGTERNETAPVFNWWKDSYTGNECIYVKNDLTGLKAGDKIVSLSYNCISGSASGGNFNVRLKNTSKNAFNSNDDAYDVSVMEVGYNDMIYGNVTLGSYSTGDWITFDLNEPFVYDGENIIIDIRNTAPADYQGWCYFASTEYPCRRVITWRNANSENVESSGFNGLNDSGIYGGLSSEPSIVPNVRITYIPVNSTQMGDVNGDGHVNSADITALYDWMLNGDTTNLVNGDVNNDGSINSADVTAVYDILLGN